MMTYFPKDRDYSRREREQHDQNSPAKDEALVHDGNPLFLRYVVDENRQNNGEEKRIHTEEHRYHRVTHPSLPFILQAF